MSDLVILHGALGAAEQFITLSHTLSPEFTVHTLNFEGHGPRPTERPFRVEHLAENLIDLLDEQGIQRADVFGYSMGGYVALWSALHHPERIGRVFSLGAMLSWSPELAERENRMLDAQAISAKVPAFAAILEARHTAIGWEAVLQSTKNRLRDLGARDPLGGDALSAVDIPVRLAIGDRDRSADLEDTYRAYKTLPNAQFEVFPGTPHPIEKIKTDRLAASIRAFFTV